MNKELKHCYLANRWSKKETLLQYLREKDCFHSIGDRPNANPYWYGAIMDFGKVEKELKTLLENHSIKLSRMAILLTNCEYDIYSPIVRLVGIYGKRILKIVDNTSE